jgi:signal transduction histidine kinase
MNKVKLMWHRPAWQGLLEGLCISALMLWSTLPTLRDAPDLVINMLILLITGVCAGWAGARIRLRSRFDRRTILNESLLALVLTAGHFAVVLALLWANNAFDLPLLGPLGKPETYAFLALSFPAFLASHCSGYALRSWKSLRARRYVWELTHSLLTTIVLTGSLAICIGIFILAFNTGMDLARIPSERLFSTLLIWVFTLFFLALVIGAVFLVVFSLPSFALSYGIAYRMTRRIESLSIAAERMRTGDLSARVLVEGEDEMAALQANFNAMAADLQSSSRAIQAERDTIAGLVEIQRELTAGVSHELRTPAATILAHSESLLHDPDVLSNDFIRGNLEVIAHEAGRLQSILTDLLTLSQNQTGRVSLRLQPVSVEAVVKSVFDNLAPLAWNQKRVQVIADLSSDLQHALTDPGRLEQILINLIQNGIRHTPPGGLVIISAGNEAEWIWLEIADTGEGISAQDLPHIWEPFYRAHHPDEVSSDGGFGLGLSLVKEMVEVVGGRIEV